MNIFAVSRVIESFYPYFLLDIMTYTTYVPSRKFRDPDFLNSDASLITPAQEKNLCRSYSVQEKLSSLIVCEFAILPLVFDLALI